MVPALDRRFLLEVVAAELSFGNSQFGDFGLDIFVWYLQLFELIRSWESVAAFGAMVQLYLVARGVGWTRDDDIVLSDTEWTSW